MTAKQTRPVLKVEKRKIAGRKVKNLRKEGILPANIYGKKVKSLNIKVILKDLKNILDKVGETGLVDLEVKGVKKERTVLLKNPQYDPISDQVIHIDFYQVDLTEKVSVDVPVEIVGESPAAKRGEGILVHLLNEIEVEALPEDLPERFVVDVAKLEKVGDAITVADLKVDSKKVKIDISPDQVVARIDELAEEIEEAPPVIEEEVVEGEEGEAKPAEGEEKKEEAKPEEEKKEKKK